MVLHHIGGQTLSAKVNNLIIDCVSDMNILYSDPLEGKTGNGKSKANFSLCFLMITTFT